MSGKFFIKWLLLPLLGLALLSSCATKTAQAGQKPAAEQAVTAGVVTPQGDPAAKYVILHYHRNDGQYQGWGLHLWGDAIASHEGTTWTEPKLFQGVDDYGAYVVVDLADAKEKFNFIVHKGNTKDPGPDMYFYVSQLGSEVWLMTGSDRVYTSKAAALGRVMIHYHNDSGDYKGFSLELGGTALDDEPSKSFSGVDSYGAYGEVKINDATKPLDLSLVQGGKTVMSATVLPEKMSDVWLIQGDAQAYGEKLAALKEVVIHYTRIGGDYQGWGLHLWGDGVAQETSWDKPQPFDGQDDYGVFARIKLKDPGLPVNFIIHKGNSKDPGVDMAFAPGESGYEVWLIQGNETIFHNKGLTTQALAKAKPGDITTAKAYWLTPEVMVWKLNAQREELKQYSFALFYSPDGQISQQGKDIKAAEKIPLPYGGYFLSVDPLYSRFPFVSNSAKIDTSSLAARIPELLKGFLVIAAYDGSGELVDATAIQSFPVIDALLTYDGNDLGVSFQDHAPVFKLWAPTAQSVVLLVYDSADPEASPLTTLAMTPQKGGVWAVSGKAEWKNLYYLYEVEVFARSAGKVVKNRVTDPYSLNLSMNSRRSQIVDLADSALKPAGWDNMVKPVLDKPEDIVLYELHVRDFSASDPKVPDTLKGKFLAFTLKDSYGMQHLQALAEAGLTHVHLLPSFDIATINEDPAQRKEPDEAALEKQQPDSELQQQIVGKVRDFDSYNWGYDPYHFTVPEGSYSTAPNGTARIVEFREMVQSLNVLNLRVVMDVVFNHTNSAGQAQRSVLDKIVPGYYYRLDQNGKVQASSCCPDTASEHRMMEKLMIDSLLTWARQYKVDGFRFDLMGHHTKENMVHIRKALDSLTLKKDGVDGKKIYIYGEAWRFGSLNDIYGDRAFHQVNTYGVGIGSFNDRLRDCARGGNFEHRTRSDQGFIDGLFYDYNKEAANAETPEKLQVQRGILINYTDNIRLALAGNLRNYSFINAFGRPQKGSRIMYRGNPDAGYTADPQENINYVSAHDNYTLWDQISAKAPFKTSGRKPATATLKERARMQMMGLSLVALGQGVPFFHAGSELLRSKSGDGDSYDSGDWFNRLDFSYQSNNWGVGLPPAWRNRDEWAFWKPRLKDKNLKADQKVITMTLNHFKTLLRIRKDSELFRLSTARDIRDRVLFLNAEKGREQLPGLIVMEIKDKGTELKDLDPRYDAVVALFNATRDTIRFSEDKWKEQKLVLHPLLAGSPDQTVAKTSFDPVSGTISIPARTTVIYVLPQK